MDERAGVWVGAFSFSTSFPEFRRFGRDVTAVAKDNNSLATLWGHGVEMAGATDA